MKEEKKLRGGPPVQRSKTLQEKKPRGRPRKKIDRIPSTDLSVGQAKRFTQARKLSGYSYYELAKRSGIPLGTVHRLEQGQLLRGATTYTIFQLAQVLQEDPGWLAFGTGKSLLAEKTGKKES